MAPRANKALVKGRKSSKDPSSRPVPRDESGEVSLTKQKGSKGRRRVSASVEVEVNVNHRNGRKVSVSQDPEPSRTTRRTQNKLVRISKDENANVTVPAEEKSESEQQHASEKVDKNKPQADVQNKRKSYRHVAVDRLTSMFPRRSNLVFGQTSDSNGLRFDDSVSPEPAVGGKAQVPAEANHEDSESTKSPVMADKHDLSSSFHIVSDSGRSSRFRPDETYETIFDPTCSEVGDAEDVASRSKEEEEAYQDTEVDYPSPPEEVHDDFNGNEVKSEDKSSSTVKVSAVKKPHLGVKKKIKKRNTGYADPGNDYRRVIRKYASKMDTPTGKLSVGAKALEIISNLLSDCFHRIASESGKLVRITKKKTMTEKTITSAVKMVIRGDLAQHSIQKAAIALLKFKQST